MQGELLVLSVLGASAHVRCATAICSVVVIVVEVPLSS